MGALGAQQVERTASHKPITVNTQTHTRDPRGGMVGGCKNARRRGETDGKRAHERPLLASGDAPLWGSSSVNPTVDRQHRDTTHRSARNPFSGYTQQQECTKKDEQSTKTVVAFLFVL